MQRSVSWSLYSHRRRSTLERERERKTIHARVPRTPMVWSERMRLSDGAFRRRCRMPKETSTSLFGTLAGPMAEMRGLLGHRIPHGVSVEVQVSCWFRGAACRNRANAFLKRPHTSLSTARPPGGVHRHTTTPRQRGTPNSIEGMPHEPCTKLKNLPRGLATQISRNQRPALLPRAPGHGNAAFFALFQGARKNTCMEHTQGR